MELFRHSIFFREKSLGLGLTCNNHHTSDVLWFPTCLYCDTGVPQKGQERKPEHTRAFGSSLGCSELVSPFQLLQPLRRLLPPHSPRGGAEAPPRAEHTALTERLLADADIDHEPLHGSPEDEEEGQEAVGAEALPAGHPPQEAPQAAAHQHGCGDMTGMGGRGGGRPWSPRLRPAANQRGRRLAPPPTRSPPSAGPASRRAVPRDARGGALLGSSAPEAGRGGEVEATPPRAARR